MGTIKRFNSKLALLPEAAARRLHARAVAVDRLKPETRKWLHVNQYGDMLQPDDDIGAAHEVLADGRGAGCSGQQYSAQHDSACGRHHSRAQQCW